MKSHALMKYVPAALLVAGLAATPLAFAGSDDPTLPGPDSSPIVDREFTRPPAVEPAPLPSPVAAPPVDRRAVVVEPGSELPPLGTTDGCRAVALPERTAWIARPVNVPARTAEECVPVYETVQAPVFEERRTPEYRDVQVPVHATREVPCFEDRVVPRYGLVEVPVYREVTKPVGFSLWNPFGCDDLDVHLWDACEKVQCGVEIRNEVVGHDTERVQVGTRTETYVSHHETRRERIGERCETVQVGTRDEQRLVGYRTETRVVEPARTEIVRERVRLPAESVTVASGDVRRAALLPGTTRVLSEDDYRREIANLR